MLVHMSTSLILTMLMAHTEDSQITPTLNEILPPLSHCSSRILIVHKEPLFDAPVKIQAEKD